MFNKNLSVLQNKDIITEEANKPQILPTLVPFEASSHVQEDEELSSEGNANANKEGELEAAERRDESTPVLMSDDELAELLKKEEEEEEEQEAEESVLQEEEVDKSKMESSEITEDEKTEVEKKMLDDKPEMETEVIDGEEQTDDESEEDGEMLEKEEVVVQKISPEESQGGSAQAEVESGGPRALFEETDGSTESEIPADLDYAADSGVLQPLQIISGRLHSLSHDIQPLPKTEVTEKIPSEKDLPATGDDFEQDVQNTEDNEEASEKTSLLDKDSGATAKKTDAVKKEPESDGDIQELSESTGSEMDSDVSEKEEEKGKNDSHPKVKVRKQKKNKRARKHSPQGDDPHTGQEQSRQDADGSSSNDNTVQKAKRRRAGKWVKELF